METGIAWRSRSIILYRLVCALLIAALLLAGMMPALPAVAGSADGSGAVVTGYDGEQQSGDYLASAAQAMGEDSIHAAAANEEWVGLLISRPENSLQGTWTVQITPSTALTVIATGSTHFNPANLSVYQENVWVKVKGMRAPDGTVLATHIRLDDYQEGELIVRVTLPALLPILRLLYGLTLKSDLLAAEGIYLLTTNGNVSLLPEQLALELPGVLWAEVNLVSHTPEGGGYKTWRWGGPSQPDGYQNQYAFQQVGLPAVTQQYNGDGVIVAVLDTGIYKDHEQFAGRLIWPSLDVIDKDMAPDDPGPGLSWGHGTHVAGIIATMAPGAKILPVRVLDSNGRGSTFQLAYAIKWAVAQGADVINLSLGTDGYTRIVRDAIADAVAAGVVVVAAVGNSDTDKVQYPAAFPNVLGVTSLSFDEGAGSFVKAPFANYGAGWVDLATPGEGIVSAGISEQGPGYAIWSGTSMSAGFVSGAAALAIQKFGGSLPATAMPAAVADLLIGNGTELPATGNPWDGKIGRLLAVDRALVGAQASEDGQLPDEQLPEAQAPDAQLPDEQAPNEQAPNEQVPSEQLPDEQVSDEPVPNEQSPDVQVPGEQTPDGQEPDQPLPEGQASNPPSRQLYLPALMR